MKKIVKTISVAEARKRFAQIIDEVRQGTVYIVVRYGKEVMRLTSSDTDETARISPKLKKELSSVFERYEDALRELSER